MYLKKLYLNSSAASTGSDSANKIKEGNNMTKELSNEKSGYVYTKKDIMSILNVGEATFQRYISELSLMITLDYINGAHGERMYNEEALKKFQLLYASKKGFNANDTQNKINAVEQISQNILSDKSTNTDILIKQSEIITAILYNQKDQQNQIDEIRDIATKALNKPQITVQYPTSGYKTTERTAMQYLSKKLHRMISYQELPEKKMFSRAWTDESGEHINNFKAYDVDDLNRII